MRPIIYIACFLLLIALGAWAYRENYETKTAQREVTALQNEIAQLREALAVQRAEWAYLNRPERLRDLATLNFDRLGLLPMESSQFGAAADIAYPAPDAGLAKPANDAALLGAQEPPVAITPPENTQVLP
jgi:hypothetical protein